MINTRAIYFLFILFFLPSITFAQFQNNVLSQAVDNTQFEFLSDSPGFFAQTAITNFGGDAARSDNIGNDEVAVFSTEFFDPRGLGGQLTFDWRVSSESNFDFLIFIILDENLQLTDQIQISGERGWSTVSLEIPPGNQVLAWGYVKDGSVSTGLDAGFVDRVRITRNGDEQPDDDDPATLAILPSILLLLDEDIE